MIICWIASGLKTLGQAIALPFLKVKHSSRLQFIARWCLHGICVIGIVGCLAFLNYAMRLDAVLMTPHPLLRNVWLPALFLQVYGISWLGWWLCRVFTSGNDKARFPDIDQAWNKIETALNRSEVDLTEKPLFLLLGTPSGSTANFLNAGQIVRTVGKTPCDDDAPFHAYAGEEGIYICCEQTSLLGRQSTMFAKARKFAEQNHVRPTGSINSTRSDAPVAPDEFAVGPTSYTAEVTPSQGTSSNENTDFLYSSNNDISTSALPMSGATSVLSRPETKKATSSSQVVSDQSLALIEYNIALIDESIGDDAQTYSTPKTKKYQAAKKLVLPLLQHDAEISETTSRLSYLCSLIRKARDRYCSVNGIVVLIPLAGSESQEIANHTGMLIEQDLQAITNATQIDAPRIAVFCDIQEETGCVDLLNRFPEQQRDRRLGIKFPRLPACDRDSMGQMIVDGVNWMCQKLIPPVVNRLFQTERTGGNTEDAVNKSNERLYEFMLSIRHRSANFERIIRRAFLGNRQPGELLRGCYLAATGRDSISEQGFTAGIFSQLFEMQNDVQWTEDALANDKDLRRWTVLGYASVATVSVVALLMILL